MVEEKTASVHQGHADIPGDYNADVPEDNNADVPEDNKAVPEDKKGFFYLYHQNMMIGQFNNTLMYYLPQL